MSWADRIAYVCHDFEDAVHVGIVTPEMLPDDVAGVVGSTRRRQLHQFITAMIATIADHGVIGMDQDHADALRSFRAFNYEHIYTRPASLRQAEEVIQLLQALVEYYADRPHAIPDHETVDRRYERPPDPPCAAGSPAAFHAAVRYVAGMTDRYAYRQASQLLDWPSGRLPIGIG